MFYTRKRDFGIALKYYKESLKYAKEMKYLELIANNLNNIGAVYTSLNDLKSALSCYEKSLKIFVQLDMPSKIQLTRENIENLITK